MKILLIRHGSRVHDRKLNDDETPLSDEGKGESWQRGDLLGRMNLRPTLYFTSRYRHAYQMGQLLAAQLSTQDGAPVAALSALTPHQKTWRWEEIMDEAEAKQIAWRTDDVVAIIGHEPRLSRLFLRLTGQRTRPLQRAEVVCLTAPTFTDFWQGRGQVAFRLPVTDDQEEQLRGKVESKMAVATLLAGFAFAVLVELLTGAPTPLRTAEASIWQMTAVISLTTAVALFIAAVYMYDRLAMPSGFWVFGSRAPKWWRTRFAWIDDRLAERNLWGKQFATDRNEQGLLYAYMVWIWKFVFTPALLFGLLGFLALLIDSRNPILIGGGLIAVGLTFIYYLLTRPQLGTD